MRPIIMKLWAIFWILSFLSLALIWPKEPNNYYLELSAWPAMITIIVALALAVVLPPCLAAVQIVRGIENRKITQIILGVSTFAIIEYSILTWDPNILLGVLTVNWIVIAVTIFYPEKGTKLIQVAARGALM